MSEPLLSSAPRALNMTNYGGSPELPPAGVLPLCLSMCNMLHAIAFGPPALLGHAPPNMLHATVHWQCPLGGTGPKSMARPGIEGRFSPVLAANHVGNSLSMSAENQTFEPQIDTMVQESGQLLCLCSQLMNSLGCQREQQTSYALSTVAF